MFLVRAGRPSSGSQKRSGGVAAAAFLSLSLAAAAFAAGPRFSVHTYTVNSLPAFPVALSENGTYHAGNRSIGSIYHPYYIDSNFHPIPTLASPANNDQTESLATGINNSGHVVGTSFLEPGNPVRHAWLFKDGILRDLSDVLQTTHSQANAINNNGWIVGVASDNNPFFGRAFLLKTGANDVLIDLGPGAAYGISENGYVVGETTGPNDTGRVPFVFKDTDNDNIVDAGELVKLTLFQGTTIGRANDVNDSGRVVGECQPGGGTVVGCMWATPTANAVPTSLGHINAQAPQTIPRSINNSNQVVGLSGGLAFLWETNAIKYLGSLVPVQQGQASWETYGATAINNTGWIAGSGVPVGGTVDHGFILKPNGTQPPPPVAATLKKFELKTKAITLINGPVPVSYEYEFTKASNPATPCLVTVTKVGEEEPVLALPFTTTAKKKTGTFSIGIPGEGDLRWPSGNSVQPGTYTVTFINGQTQKTQTLTINKLRVTSISLPPTITAGTAFDLVLTLSMKPPKKPKITITATISNGIQSFPVKFTMDPKATSRKVTYVIPAGSGFEGNYQVTASFNGTVQASTTVVP